MLILYSGCEPEEEEAGPVSILGNWQASEINVDFTISVPQDTVIAAIEAQLMAYGVPQVVLDQAAPILQAAITDLIAAESGTRTTADLGGGDVAFSVRFSEGDSCAIHFLYTILLMDGTPIPLDYNFIGSWTLTNSTLALIITTDDMALEGVVAVDSDMAPTQILLSGDMESQLAVDWDIPIVFPPSPTEYMIHLEDIPVLRHTVVEVTLTMTGT